MLAPVDLNDQLSLEADKIEDVVLERDLPAKLDSIQPAVAEQEPKFLLGIRCDPAHRAGMLAQSGFHRLMTRRL